MGASITAYVVYGMRASTKLAKIYERIRGCSHDVSEGMNFCPTCGKKAFIEHSSDMLTMFNDEGLSYFATSYGSDTCVIGFCLARSNPEFDDGDELGEVLPKETMELIEFFAVRGITVTADDFCQHLVVHYE